MKTNKQRSFQGIDGYTLIEVMVASTLLSVGIAAATVLSLTMASQEDANQRVSRALHLQECAARLFQIGLSGDEIDLLLPNDPTIRNSTTSAPYTKVSFVVTSETAAGFGSFEQGICTMNFSSTASSVGTWTAGTWTGGEAADRTRELTVVRPSIR
ncbi:MAG: prepilin-type N-terminal cleavage/methylation domain-containing protein [Verrucomicrobiales bacterium]|jgi:prepilin-type N-terminal cleavage/methylation domain-containing protein